MRKIVTEQEKLEWKERYLAGETCREISKDYDYNENTISKHIRKMGISRGKGNLPKYLELKPKILEEYQANEKMTLTDLANKYNISDRTVSDWIKDAGLQVKQKSGKISSCNEHYFQIIDTPNKAYLLGFITADGAVVKKRENNSKSCSIEVHKKDKDLILFAQQEINPNATITDCSYEKKQNCRISFSSTKLCNDLEKYGIVQNKSKIIKRVPKELIPKDLLPFYFRGLIDGDGCAHKDGGVSIYSGSKEFIESVQNILVEETGVKKLSIYIGTTYFISWHSYGDRKKLFDYLYGNLNSTFYYKRKYERIRESLQGNTEVSNQIAKGQLPPQSVEGE